MGCPRWIALSCTKSSRLGLDAVQERQIPGACRRAPRALDLNGVPAVDCSFLYEVQPPWAGRSTGKTNPRSVQASAPRARPKWGARGGLLFPVRSPAALGWTQYRKDKSPERAGERPARST